MTREEQTALKTVMSFLSNYSKKDAEGCMAAITKSEPMMVLGTNDNEVFKTIPEIRAAFKKDFKCMNNIRWGKRRNFHVKAVPTLASVIVELPVSYRSDGEKIKTLFRYALTLTKEGDKWKICSGMATVPFASDTYSF
jgi:ketosteroid isomerase-like protein